jgi:hypothetical protein
MTLAERWVIALTVTCGLPSCAQVPGDRCINTVNGEPRDEPHWNRWARGEQARTAIATSLPPDGES